MSGNNPDIARNVRDRRLVSMPDELDSAINISDLESKAASGETRSTSILFDMAVFGPAPDSMVSMPVYLQTSVLMYPFFPGLQQMLTLLRISSSTAHENDMPHQSMRLLIVDKIGERLALGTWVTLSASQSGSTETA